MDKTKILLVDDEADFLELMEARVNDWGFESIKASNGKEAVNAVKTKKPDIVVLDYMLPDMDGVSTLRAIRKINGTIPVIMFTAYPDAKAIKDSKELGICAFIPKLSVYTEVLPSLRSAIEMLEKKLSKKD